MLATVAPSALWYLTRATGAVALLLLTASVVLGIITVGRLQSSEWPRFVTQSLHRNVSLLALALLLVHIVSSILDPFAGIHVLDTLVPFVGIYRPFWLGLGTFSFDLLIAVALTSALRRYIGYRVWRVTHWFAYLCWPVALLHSVGTGSDIKQTWMLALTGACVLAVLVAVGARVGFGWPRARWVRVGAAAATLAGAAAFAIWLPSASGPLTAGWAVRAGTPASDLRQVTNSTGPGAAFSASVTGTVGQRQTGNGLSEVSIALVVANQALSNITVHIDGKSINGGVQMTASAVTLGPASNPALYHGTVTSLAGTDIGARVVSASGGALQISLILQIPAATGSATGTVQVSPSA
jgi:hypothetical protein